MQSVLNEIKEIIYSLFARHANLDCLEVRALECTNYFEAKLMDSIAFVSFIADLEDTFHITFSSEDLQNKVFQSLAGLIQLVKDKVT